MLKRIFIVLLSCIALGTMSYAQVTTSSISGRILNDAGAGLQGASVVATHLPTGSVYKGITTDKGTVVISNARVGGPYRIEISYVGLKSDVIEGVYLQLGQPYEFRSILSVQDKALEEVIVSGRRNALLNATKTGANTTVSRTQIEKLPSITRSVNDLTRLTPQANGTSIGGGNYRSNNFTVDGANFNNQFGIGQNVPAGGSPISLDALEQISVNVTPYDVRQSGFTGAAVNAVTRSGKNQFFATAFYSGRTDKQQGVRIGDVTTAINSLKIKQYGVSVGGPIIKNKLFFFVNLEQEKTVEPGPTKVAATTGMPFGSASYIARPRATFLDSVSKYLQDTYGYETGPYQGYSNDKNNDKFFARIDWNIAQNHKINFRYSSVKSKSPSLVSTSVSGSGLSTPASANNRQSINALHFANSNYFQEDNLFSGTVEYNGVIGKLNHSLRASYVNQNAPRSSPSSLFPLVDILDGAAVLTTFGYEPFTYGNLRDVKTTTVNYDANYNIGEHTLTAGLQYEDSKTKNGFQRFGTGYYVFNSWSDFVNGAKASNYALTYPLTKDGSQAFPSFAFRQISLYLQDEYKVNAQLKITAGLRIEMPSYPDVEEVKTHPLVAGLTFANNTKVNTGVLPKTTPMFAPRLGFNYDVVGDKSILLRGGTGIFTGRIPFVWIVSQSGDAQLLQATITRSGQANTPVFSPDPKANFPTSLEDPTQKILGNISSMAPDLKFPQTWKSSIGVDFNLPLGIVATVEGIFNKDVNAVIGKNVNLVDPTPLGISGYADNRLVYPSGITSAVSVNRYINKLANSVPSSTGTAGFDVIQLSNAKGGYYWSATAQLTKQTQTGFFGTIAYTLSGAKNYGDGAGDQIANVWGPNPFQYSGNPNSPSLSYTDNVLPHRIVGSLSYTNKWIGNLNTTMTLFYSGQHQGRYSYMYSTDFNRDNNANDLIYVPKDASEITFVATGTSGYAKNYTPQEQSDIFFNFINNDPYLKDRKGQYAERNGAVMPWRNQFDFRLSQQIMNCKAGGKHSLELFWDVFNIGNLFNSNWGTFDIANNALLVPQNVAAMGGSVKPTFKVNAYNGDIVRSRTRVNQTITSTYYMQFGVRYNFN